MKRRDPFHARAARELMQWPGVTCRREDRNGGHSALILTFRGESATVFYPGSTSDTAHAPKKHVSTIRRELERLGAKRIKPPTRAGAAAKRPRMRAGAPSAPAAPPTPAGPPTGPTRDPWAALEPLRAKHPQDEDHQHGEKLDTI